MAYIPFIGKHYEDRSSNFNSEKTINMYLEFSESPLSKSTVELIGTPGLKLFTTVTPTAGAVCRGIYTSSDNRLFTIVGDTLAEISNTGIVTSRGTLNTSTTPVKMVDNGVELIIVDGTNGYILTLSSNAFAAISDVDFPNGCTHVVFQDQYFIVNQINTRNYFVSGLLDGTSWNALDFGTAEYAPDNIRSLLTLRSNLWIFCENTIEVHYNSGNADFPFQRIQGAVQEFGIAAKYSVAKTNNSIFWLGSNEEGEGIVFKSTGYNAQRISDHSIEYQIGKMNGIDDAIGYTYQDEGHYFYVLTFQIGNKTFVFDDSNQTWHERSWRNPSDGSNNRHRGLYQTLFNQKNYVGDFENGKIYELDLDTYTDNGDVILRLRRGPHIHDSEKRIFYNSIQIDMQEAVGLVTGQGSDPQLTLEWSDDNGPMKNTRYLDMGKVGEYGTRVKTTRLGSSRDRVFQITITDPVKVHLINMIADIEQEI